MDVSVSLSPPVDASDTLVVILGMVHKYQIPWFYPVNLIDTIDQGLGIADNAGANELGNLSQRLRSRKSHKRTLSTNVRRDLSLPYSALNRPKSSIEIYY